MTVSRVPALPKNLLRFHLLDELPSSFEDSFLLLSQHIMVEGFHMMSPMLSPRYPPRAPEKLEIRTLAVPEQYALICFCSFTRFRKRSWQG